MKASAVPIETFDSMMTRIWRNIREKTPDMDAKVRRAAAAAVSIPLPGAGAGKPILRLNALPILSVPEKCLELTFAQTKEWVDLRNAQRDREFEAIFTKAESVWCWGAKNNIKKAFGADLLSIKEREVPTNLGLPGNLHVQGFLEEALSIALARNRAIITLTKHIAGNSLSHSYLWDLGYEQPRKPDLQGREQSPRVA